MKSKFALIYTVTLLSILVLSPFIGKYQRLNDKYIVALRGQVRNIEILTSSSATFIDSVLIDGTITEDEREVLNKDMSQIVWLLDWLAYQESYFIPTQKYEMKISEYLLEIENYKSDSNLESLLPEIGITVNDLDKKLEELIDKDGKDFYKNLDSIIYIE